MTRFRFSSLPRFRSFALLVAMTGFVWTPQNAHADEFSLLPLGDPIYAQLQVLTRSNDAKETQSASLTRYEAALQAARAILDVQNRDAKTVSRANWRAIKVLCNSLKSELRQLGVDVESALALAERGLKVTDSPAPAPLSPRSGATKTTSANSSSAASSGALGANATGANPTGSLLLSGAGMANRNLRTNTVELPISQRLRAVGSVVMPTSADRASAAAVSGSIASSGLSNSALTGSGDAALASQNALTFDYNSYLTLRAATSRRRLGLAADNSPLLSGALFQGASSSSAAGGGVDVNMGALRLRTDFERLLTDTGAGASRIGGGASLSGWQNRLWLDANLSRLVPEDKTTLPSTAAQVGLGLDLTQRFRLNFLYQGLFAEAAKNSASRVSGGLSLSF